MSENSRQQEQLIRMTDGPIKKVILTLAVPCIISMLVSSFYSMADTYFVSQLNKSASGATGVCFTIMAVIQAVGFGVGMGCGNRLSVALGRKDTEEAEKLAGTAFFLAIGIGLLIAVAGKIFLDPILGGLGATKTILPYAREYASYILYAAPFMIGGYVQANILRSQGNSFASMIGVSVGCVLNCGLDPLFIFVFDWGIAGAAIATAISQVASFFVMLYNINRGKNAIIRIHPKNFAPSAKRLKAIISTGSPSFLRQIIAAIAVTCLNNAAKPFGDGAIAAMAIVSRVMFFMSSALMGYYQGFQIFCGYNLGAENHDRVYKGFWFVAKTAIICVAAISLVAVIFAPQIISAFRPDKDVVEIGSMALRVQSALMPVMTWVVLLNFYYQVTGRPLETNVFAVTRQGIFYIPLVILLPRYIGILGIEISQAVADVITLLVTMPLGIKAVKELRQNRDRTLARKSAESAEAVLEQAETEAAGRIAGEAVVEEAVEESGLRRDMENEGPGGGEAEIFQPPCEEMELAAIDDEAN